MSASHPCKHCGTEFTAKRSLDRHMKTAKFCLDLQREQGLDVKEEVFRCECGSDFNLKHNLTRHQASCPSTTVNVGQMNVTQNMVNQQININILGSTMSSLTPELVKEKVIEALSVSSVERGLAQMVQDAAPAIFQNEKNIWLVRVADAGRNKLIQLTDTGEETDIKGAKTAAMLRAPFRDVSLSALEETKRPKLVEQTIDEINDDRFYQTTTVNAILQIAPSTFKSQSEAQAEAFRLAEEQSVARMDAYMKKRKREAAKAKQLEAAKWRDDFLDKCQNLHDGTFWHPIRHFVIQMDSRNVFTILGRRERRGDTTVQLTKADIATLADMGLGPQLDAQYQSRSGTRAG
jgi:hypothetical protein